jgi:hypothetical protein
MVGESANNLKIMNLACLILPMLISAAAASAMPINYIINFTGTGPLPTSSFTYDASLSSNNFANFMVTWGGTEYDLTASANQPYVSGVCGASSSPAAAFSFLISETCGVTPLSLEWIGVKAIGLNAFTLDGNLVPDGDTEIDVSSLTFAGDMSLTGSGSFRVVAAPEPTTVAMALAGFALLLANAVRGRRKGGANQAIVCS